MVRDQRSVLYWFELHHNKQQAKSEKHTQQRERDRQSERDTNYRTLGELGEQRARAMQGKFKKINVNM